MKAEHKYYIPKIGYIDQEYFDRLFKTPENLEKLVYLPDKHKIVNDYEYKKLLYKVDAN